MATRKIVDISVRTDLDRTNKQIKDLNISLEEAKQNLDEAEQEFGFFSQEAAEAAKNVKSIEAEINKLSNSITKLDGPQKFEAMGKAVSGVAGGFAVIQSSIALAGIESEQFEQTMVKLNAVMAMTSGFQAIAEMGKSFNNIRKVAVGAFTSIRTSASAAFTGIKAGLIATGLGAFIVALGLVVAYWDDIKRVINDTFPALKEMGDTVDMIKDAFFGLVNVVKNRVFGLFRALTSLLKGNLKEAGENLKQAFNDMEAFQEGYIKNAQERAEKQRKQEIEDTIVHLEHSLALLRAAGEDTIELERHISETKRSIWAEDSDEFKKELREQEIRNATHSKKLADEAKARRDKAIAEAKAERERLKAIQDGYNNEQLDAHRQLLLEIENLNATDNQKKLDLEKKRSQEEINNLKGANKEQLAEIQAFHDEKYRILQENLNKETQASILAIEAGSNKEIEQRLNSFQKQIEFSQASSDIELDILKANKASALQIEQEAKMAELIALQQSNEAKLIEAGASEEMLNELRKNQEETRLQLSEVFNNEQLAIEDQFTNAKILLTQREMEARLHAIAVISSAMSEATILLGQETAAGKALAIAQATMDTYASAVSAYKSTVVIPIVGPKLAPIAAGAAVMAGMNNVKEIMKVQVPGGGGVGGSSPSSNISKLSATTQFQNTPQTEISEGIASSTQGDNQPIRAYIVASEVESSVALERRITSSNRID